MSAVIKAGESRATSRGACTLDLRDIASAAQAALAQAQQEARIFVEAARQQAARERVQQREAGYKEGRELGAADGRQAGYDAALAEARERFAADSESIQAALRKLIEEFAGRRETLYTLARRDVLILAIALAERVCHGLQTMEQEISESAMDACREALELLSAASQVIIHAHPDDLAAVEKLSASWAQSQRANPHVKVVGDPAVGRGGVSVETPDSSIDATVATRLDRLADEMLSNWRARRAALGAEL